MSSYIILHRLQSRTFAFLPMCRMEKNPIHAIRNNDHKHAKKNRLLLNMALVYAILCMQVYTVSHRIDLPSCKFSSSPTLRYNEQATLHGHALFHKFRILFAGSKLVQESSSEWREQDRYKMLTRPWVG